MAPNNVACVNAPAFARASVIARHPPTQHRIQKLWRQVHYRRNKAFRVPAPRRTTSDRTASVGRNRTVVTTTLKAAQHSDVSKCISAVNAELQNAPVEAEVGILTRRFEIEVVSECQPHVVGFRGGKAWRVEVLVADYRRI